MRKRNLEYEAYLLKQFAKEELASEQNLPVDSIPEEEVEARMAKLKNSLSESNSNEVVEAAETWLKGFERMAADVESGLPDGDKETMIFSILGSNLLVHLCKKLGVNNEHLTIETQRDAAAMVREFSKIFMWVGGNVQELYKEVPSVK
jgi:hypothetical protein